MVCEPLRNRGFQLECKITKDSKVFSPVTLAQWDVQAEPDTGGAGLRPVTVHWWARPGWWVQTVTSKRGSYGQPLEEFWRRVGRFRWAYLTLSNMRRW